MFLASPAAKDVNAVLEQLLVLGGARGGGVISTHTLVASQKFLAPCSLRFAHSTLTCQKLTHRCQPEDDADAVRGARQPVSCTAASCLGKASCAPWPPHAHIHWLQNNTQPTNKCANSFGVPEPTQVDLKVKHGPCILVRGVAAVHRGFSAR